MNPSAEFLTSSNGNPLLNELLRIRHLFAGNREYNDTTPYDKGLQLKLSGEVPNRTIKDILSASRYLYEVSVRGKWLLLRWSNKKDFDRILAFLDKVISALS